MLINLYWTWQDEKYLYRVDDSEIEDNDKNRECHDIFKFHWISSQLALIIHYIHSYGMIHGNINPESIHITANSVKLGSFKYLRRMEGGKRLKGVCGDFDDFRAPECGKEEYFEEIDWYSYGKVLEYYSKDFERPDDLKDLIHNLTRESAVLRLGYGPAGFKSIRSHLFFRNTDWSTLLTQKTDLTERKKYGSLSASIESLKCRTEDQKDGWREFVEFNWEENGEIGQMLETIIKRI
jgi:serine/threonine protein kinase